MSFEVATYADLKKVGTGIDGWNLDSDYVQTANIDASDSATENWNAWREVFEGWENIGTWDTPFSGTYDGQSYTISNLHMDRFQGDDHGLFGTISGEVSNLSVINADIGGDFQVGIIAGNITGTVINCYSTGNVSGSISVGGFCGYNDEGTFSNCYSTGNVSGSYGVGGFCGYNYVGTFSNCYSTGNVSGYGVGGFCGYNDVGTFSNCCSTGNVSGTDYDGGFCGYNDEGTFSNCYSTGNVSGTEYIGGFCGYNYVGTFSNCYSTGNVSGSISVGGFCGYNYVGTFSNCYWDKETSDQSTSNGGTGLTTAEMTHPHSENAYVNWNFRSIWFSDIAGDNSGYPMLLAFIDDYILTFPVISTGYTDAKIKGRIIYTLEGGSNYTAYFQYRKKGDVGWIDTDDLTIEFSQDVNEYLEDLDDGVTYEFRLILEKDDVVIETGNTEEFTTLIALATSEVVQIENPIKLSTTKEINGAWAADVEFEHQSVKCEQYIDIDDEKYLVKIPTELRGRQGAITKLTCWHIGMAELGDASIDRFNLKDSVSDFLDMILAGTLWSAGTCDISETVYLATDKRTSVLEALNILAEKCGGELYFNSTDRTVDLKREIGTFTGLHIRYDKNSDYILKEQDSTNLVTRIYPIGADNFLPYQTTISYCEEPADFTFSGAGTAEASTDKMFGSQATTLNFAVLNETATVDLGAGGVIDLSGHDTVEFWIKSATDNANGITFGIGEAAYDEQTVGSGALSAECWHKIELDLSGVADADKNAIRHFGFKNLTDGAITVIVNGIRGFSGEVYIDSPYIDKYKVKKEYVYRHSAKPEKETFEIIIYPTDDTQASQISPNRNWGSRTILGIRDNASDDKIGFIKFGDLSQIPTGATITGATLNLKVTATQFSSGGSPDIQLANANWNENTLTWNNKPGSAGNITTFNGSSKGWKEITLTDTVDDWFNEVTNNYGLRLQLNISDVDKDINIATKESTDSPYLKVTFTMTTDPSDVIVAAATKYLHDHHEPKLRYEVNMADLSKVMVHTWEDETINIGDTVKVYDSELDINVYVRVHKITKDLLNPANTKLELVNRAYTIAELEAAREKQLSYAMPCKDNPRIIDASAIQVGYLGSDVQL